MSLDVTFRTSSTGPAPPLLSGNAGAVGAKPTASDLATLFAALLANRTQASSAPPRTSAKSVVSPATEEPTREPSRRTDPPDDDNPHNDPNPPSTNLTTLLMALTAPPTTIQTTSDKPLPPSLPVANRVGDTAEITKPTTQEAMDTVPAPGPAATSAKADTADGGLLPLSLNLSAAQSVTMPVATPSVNVLLPPASTLNGPMSVETSAPPPVVVAPVPTAVPTPVAQRPVSGFKDVPDMTTRSSAFAMPPPAIPVQRQPQAVTVSGAPVLGAPAVKLALSLPPTALSLNDVRPDALCVSAPAPFVTPSISPAITPTPAVLQPAPLLPPVQTVAQAGSASLSALPSTAVVLIPAQTTVLVQTALQSGLQPANNTGMPTPKVNETAAKTPEAVHAEGQSPEFVVPLATKLQGQPTQAASAANTLGKAAAGSVSISGTPRPDTDAEKPTEQAAVADTQLAQNAAALTTTAQTSPLPQSAATALTPADRASVMRQISDGAQQMTQRPAANGVREINLQLHPHDWGQIKLSVRMTPTVGEDGAIGTSVIAHIVADNPAVKAALETHTAELRQTLQDAGMKLDRLSVTVQAPDAGAQSGAAGQEQQPFTQGSGAWSGQGTTAPQSDASAAGQSGGSGFGSAFSSNFGDGRGGQTNHQPSQPASVWAEDTEMLETMPSANISTRLPIGRWDSRA